MAETRSIGNGAQADENLRKNSRLNYESAALPTELRRRIWRRKITGKCAFREPLSCSRQCLFEANSDIPSSLFGDETAVAGGEGANGIRAKGRFAVAFVAWARCGHRIGMQ
jgi:hypothetical protein